MENVGEKSERRHSIGRKWRIVSPLANETPSPFLRATGNVPRIEGLGTPLKGADKVFALGKWKSIPFHKTRLHADEHCQGWGDFDNEN